MGFKIDSIASLRTTASNFVQTADNARSTLNNAVDALNRLQSNISGYGVDNSLSNLSDGINANGTKIVTLLQKISSFINTQSTSYETTATEASSDLEKINAGLEDI